MKKSEKKTVKSEKKTVKKFRLKKKYVVVLLILSAISLLALVIGGSYAFFTHSVSKDLVVYTGNLEVTFTNTSNVINLTNTYPMTNQQGEATDGFSFDITNTGSIDARYQVRLELKDDNTLPVEYVKLAYLKTKNDDETISSPTYSEPALVSDLNGAHTFIYNEELASTKKDSYTLKMWIDLSAPNDIAGKTFKAKIIVEAIQNVEDAYVMRTTAPSIILNKFDDGNTDINLKVNDTFTDPGVLEVKDDKDILAPSDVTVSYEYTSDGENLTTVNSVDTTVPGIYYVIYSVTDSDNLEGKIARVVNVTNAPSIPTITLNGSSTITLYERSEYVDPGITVSSGKVAIIGQVKANVPGTYIVRYIVITSAGGINSVTRTVVIQDVGLNGLARMIYDNQEHIYTNPTLNVSSNHTNDPSGLYKMEVTNGYGGQTEAGISYYFRGNVTNNKVRFAGLDWHIIRINEDGTVRIMLDSTDGNTYVINSNYTSASNLYYSLSSVKGNAETWYNNTITGDNATKVATGNYFCEAAKVKPEGYTGSSSFVVQSSYTPNLVCQTDSNGKGLLSLTVGLITYDETVLAGVYTDSTINNPNTESYISDDECYWTMSPAGLDTGGAAREWGAGSYLWFGKVKNPYRIKPVINLKQDVAATYDSTTGTYTVQ